MTVSTSNGPSATYPQDAGRAEVKHNGGLIRVRANLTGVTPLLMNAMSQQQLLDIRNKVKPSKTAAKPAPREEADEKVYRLADGRPHIPVKNLSSCLIAAGVFVRLDGKRQVTNAQSTTLPGMLQIEDVELPVLVPGKDDAPAAWEVDIQQGRSSSGDAVCIIRPRFDSWELRVTLEIDQEQMPLPMARSLVDIAGRRIGLGDGRPQRKLTFGRFNVSLWQPVLLG